MELNLNAWNEEIYQEFQSYLQSLKDDKMRDFSKKLTKTHYEILGIKLPVLRKIAKEIVKGNYNSYLKYAKCNTYEEVFVKGFVIASIKNEKEFLEYLDDYIDLIDDWSLCDSFTNSLKIVNNDLDKYFAYFTEYLNSDKTFKIRVCLILYLNFYSNEEYIDKIICNILKIKNREYYVEMAISWVLQNLYLVDKEKIINLLKENKLNKFVNNKTISKLRDSYKVSKEDKEYLKTLRKEHD